MKLAHLITRWSFPRDSAGKEFSCNAGDLSSIPGLGRSSGEGKGYLLQYSGLENSMDYIQSMGSQRVEHNWATFTFTFLSLITNHRERGIPQYKNTESNSITINAHIPKQAGCTHKPLSLKEKRKKKGRKKKGSVSKNSIGILAWSSLPCQQCSKRKKKIRSPCA